MQPNFRCIACGGAHDCTTHVVTSWPHTLTSFSTSRVSMCASITCSPGSEKMAAGVRPVCMQRRIVCMHAHGVVGHQECSSLLMPSRRSHKCTITVVHD